MSAPAAIVDVDTGHDAPMDVAPLEPPERSALKRQRDAAGLDAGTDESPLSVKLPKPAAEETALPTTEPAEPNQLKRKRDHSEPVADDQAVVFSPPPIDAQSIAQNPVAAAPVEVQTDGTGAAAPLASGASDVDSKANKDAPRYGYITLVMKGDAYVPGAVVVAHSLWLTGTKHDLLCMVTADVSEHARAQLRVVFTKVIEVPVIQFKCKRMRTAKQQQLYDSWIDVSFTKWNMLSLLDYKKLLFVDSDVVVLRNVDELFELSAPAGTFSSPWAAPYAGRKGSTWIDNGDGTGRWSGRAPSSYSSSKPSFGRPAAGASSGGVNNPYYNKHVEHKGKVPREALKDGLYEQSFVCIATMLLLEPSKDVLAGLKEMVGSAAPFGFETCNSGFDEQSIARYYYKQDVLWTHIHQRYNFIPWHPHWLDNPIADLPYVFHYFGSIDKPWKVDRAKWIDTEPFWLMASLAVSDAERYPQEQRELLRGAFNAANLASPPLRSCSYCKELKRPDWDQHSLMSPTGQLACPLFTRQAASAPVPSARSSTVDVSSAQVPTDTSTPVAGVTGSGRSWTKKR